MKNNRLNKIEEAARENGVNEHTPDSMIILELVAEIRRLKGRVDGLEKLLPAVQKCNNAFHNSRAEKIESQARAIAEAREIIQSLEWKEESNGEREYYEVCSLCDGDKHGAKPGHDPDCALKAWLDNNKEKP